MHTPFLGLHSKQAPHIWLLFHFNPFSGSEVGFTWSLFFNYLILDHTAFGFLWRFLFVYSFIAIGFTGHSQVKKICQQHIFFIFDGGKKNGSEVWFWKLQVGRVGRGLGWDRAGLVQCSNQGQIEFTCLRFRGSSANCRHTNTVSKHPHAHTHTHSRICPHRHRSRTRTYTYTHTLISLHLLIHAHAKQREGFFTPTSMCKPR